MDEDKANFDRNLSGFTLSVLYAACSELEADILSDLQTKTDDTDKTTLETNKEREETASEEERATVLGSIRNMELDRLTKAISKTRNEKNASNTDDQTNKGAVEEINTEKDTDTASEEEIAASFRSVRSNELDRLTADKGAAKEINTEMDKETASEEERAAFFKSIRSKDFDRLIATLYKQNDEAENQDVQTEPKIINTEGFQNQGETEALDTEETASEEDSLAFLSVC